MGLIKNIFIIVFSIIAIVSCTSSKIVVPGETKEEKAIYFLMKGHEIPINASMDEIKKLLGEPNSTKIYYSIIDQTNKIAITTYFLEYEGIEIAVSEYSESKNQQIVRIIFSNNKHKLKYGIGIGASKENILNIFGSDYLEKGENFEYIIYDSVNFKALAKKLKLNSSTLKSGFLTINFENEKVLRVTFNYLPAEMNEIPSTIFMKKEEYEQLESVN